MRVTSDLKKFVDELLPAIVRDIKIGALIVAGFLTLLAILLIADAIWRMFPSH